MVNSGRVSNPRLGLRPRSPSVLRSLLHVGLAPTLSYLSYWPEAVRESLSSAVGEGDLMAADPVAWLSASLVVSCHGERMTAKSETFVLTRKTSAA